VAYPGILFGVGGSPTSGDSGVETGDLGAVAPLVRGSAQFAIRFDFVVLSGCRGLLRMYFQRNWEFGSALSELRNFVGGGGVEPPKHPPLGTPLGWSL
jgi:hypothetical protein